MAPLSVTIIYNKNNNYGLQDDITVIDRIIKHLKDIMGQPILKPKLVDMREPFMHSDILIHLEIPVFSAIPFAYTNIMLVNPEQWSYSYDAYVHAFDALLFRDSFSADQFRSDFLVKGLITESTANLIHVLPWCDSWELDSSIRASNTKKFGCFLGGSLNKYEYVRKVLPYWQLTDPFLTVYTSRPDFAEELKKLSLPSNVTIISQDLNEVQQKQAMTTYAGLLICSQGEAFGYAASHAEMMGAFAIMNKLPAFESVYQHSSGIMWLSNSYDDSDKVRYALAAPTNNIREELDKAFEEFRACDMDSVRTLRHYTAFNRFPALCDVVKPLLQQIQAKVVERKPSKGIYHCPPLLEIKDCPPITIVTPTYNRKNLIAIAFHNMLATDYPRAKMEWIVIEDNEKTPHMAGERVMDFQLQMPELAIKYIPIEGRMSIGEKRNHAIENASHDIILFMDDDDHYPSTSFRRRVAWLTKGMKRGVIGADIACCTTLALYDLRRGISAVNVPPFELPFSQRISEATLTFRKSAWVERQFPHVSMAEGEDWIKGRENQVIEIPPQQIIVAFTHGGNQSSRRVPPVEQKPACFWGFPKEYLVFIHGLVGVQIEEDKSKKSVKK